ncbi:hypothetical protein ASPBRDRAFT_203624 [Aspergillus brasiliensis CBS 101740]|uniref:UBC core domain-containing protein n=1 Tax=Aspergillus brasiliensis (strain CBS 101740 / IMI 381727 / IBT 21946) TaxID=767769 RepID=A0A1L9UWG4_ASPBC|nr:hypothetical protein ASPBRDRAFT_203624 [Aspergillus brasiliensis CBS 101740]
MNTSDVPNAPKTGFPRTFKFDLDDTCCLKSNPSLTGIVVRTYLDVNPAGPPEDYLVVSYTSVPYDVLADFLQTGVPCKGYVFVEFDWFWQGYSLIHEDDLELLDRYIHFGSHVKRDSDDTTRGTVISASATCTLEPVAYRNNDESLGEYGSVEFNDWLMPRRSQRPEAGSSRPSPLHNVPLSELMHHQPFIEDDLIIYRQKLGVIRQVDRDTILRVSNVPVSLVDPNALEVPCAFEDKELIWMPNGQQCRTVGTNLQYLEHDNVATSQYVCAKYKNMRGINGSIVPREDAHSFGYGHVLSTPATEYKVEWLCTNVFGPGKNEISDGIETLRASVLERDAVKCDFGNIPAWETVRSDVWLHVGEMVRFRDPESARQRYSYQHIPTGETFGYDLNIFRIASRHTALTVRWSDGSVTTEDIKSLRLNTGIDEYIWPGGIVVLKDGIEIIDLPASERIPAYMRQLPNHRRHGESAIRARTVGVVQAVDVRERIATVRWYKDPDIVLLHGGQILAYPCSFLGELGNTVSQVSLYELDVFPCLERLHGDIVLLAPETIHESALMKKSNAYNVVGPCIYSYTSSLPLSQVHAYLDAMSIAMLNSDWFRSTTTIDTTPLPPRHSYHYQRKLNERPTADFVGQIIAIDANGEITVRLAGAGACRDIRVPFEKIMMVINVGVLGSAGIPSPSDLSTMSANMTYDNEEGYSVDPDEDEWETDEPNDILYTDSAKNLASPGFAEARYPGNADLEMRDDDSDIVMRDASDEMVEQGEEMTLPPEFLILEGSPPSDHHFISKNMAGASVLRTKCIQKEYDILAGSLPSGIFVRAWESRMDLLRVLFIGPEGTPYEYAPIVIDFYFPGDFPSRPPEAFFHSWIGGQGRINPNLYEDGKICLSILGTWPTQNPEEMWSATKSTVLQVLVSIMGLVLVKNPFYNEAGYEALAAEGDRLDESSKYTEKTFLTTRRYIKYALDHPVIGMEDIVTWNYLPSRVPSSACSRPLLLRRAIDSAVAMIEHYNHPSSEGERSASAFVSRLSLGAIVMLRKYIAELETLEVAAAA